MNQMLFLTLPSPTYPGLGLTLGGHRMWPPVAGFLHFMNIHLYN